ncbi:Chromosome (plasmid) partitioning protein ParB [hydrothermal vent metagenome]|uniref:Chromosome (Plasmid) partitioning protein ParB n=1 Tax=hydrothermal vent metagenome TaxID=652676 RepID=A0A3B1BXT7_9ZZZZ
METMTRRALGRGLSSLIPEKKESAAEASSEKIAEVPVKDISPGRFQPRTVFDESSLTDLANSIRERGVIQPIIVARKKDGYELIAGERRWRAVKSLGYEKIPAIVKIVRDSEALEMAIVENVQREDLNPIEEASAYARLMKEFAFTQETLSKKMGKSRPAVANTLRLLKLPEKIKDDLAIGALTMGHARALLALDSDDERMRMRAEILGAGMNVREVERKVKGRTKQGAGSNDVFIRKVCLDLERKLGGKVDIKTRAKGGVLNIHYHDTDDLNRILEIIGTDS